MWYTWLKSHRSVYVNNIFYGLLFVFLDLEVPFGNWKVGLIPDFIGYILIFAGLAELAAGKDRFSRMRPPAAAMAVYTGILYGIDLLGFSYYFDPIVPFALGLVSALGALYISYNIVRGVKDLEASLEQSLGSRPLFTVWIVLAAVSLAVCALFLLPKLDYVRMAAGSAAGIAFLIFMGRTKNLYYGK